MSALKSGFAKPILIFVFFACTCSFAFSQENNKIDSLKTGIVKILNDGFWNVYKGGIDVESEPYRYKGVINNAGFENYRFVFRETIAETSTTTTETFNLLIMPAVDKWVWNIEEKELYLVLKSGNYIYKILNAGDFGLRGSKRKEKERINRNNDKVNNLYLHIKALQEECAALYYKTELLNFKPVADNYLKQKEQKALSEDQRKYIVQANVLNEEKDYTGAINLFEKVVAADPTAYPAAYYNIALISAQIRSYAYAIINMKKYLMLKPNAEDARSAQDKIYEWELHLTK